MTWKDDEPTKAQVEYVEAIAEWYGIEVPTKKTKGAYSLFLSKWAEKYKEDMRLYQLENELALSAVDARRDW